MKPGDAITRFLKPVTVKDYVNWCRAHEVKPPAAQTQVLLGATKPFGGPLEWKKRIHTPV